MELHGIATDISKKKNSKKVVAVFTDHKGILGLGLGNVMASKMHMNKMLDDDNLDTIVRGKLEDAVDTIEETFENAAQGGLDKIKSADDFKVRGKRLGDVSKNESKDSSEKNSPEEGDSEKEWDADEIDSDPYFEDPDSIVRDYGSEETDELDFDGFEL